MDNDGAKQLAAFLRGNTSLQLLDVSRNTDIGRTGAIELLKALAVGLRVRVRVRVRLRSALVSWLRQSQGLISWGNYKTAACTLVHNLHHPSTRMHRSGITMSRRVCSHAGERHPQGAEPQERGARQSQGAGRAAGHAGRQQGLGGSGWCGWTAGTERTRTCMGHQHIAEGVCGRWLGAARGYMEARW